MAIAPKFLSPEERAARVDALEDLAGKVPAGPLRDALRARAKALTGKKQMRLVRYQGHLVPLRALCQSHGINFDTVLGRIERGYEVEAALTTPLNRARRPSGADWHFPLPGSKVC